MNIVLLSSESPSLRAAGGIGSYTACLAPALSRLGHEVHVISCAAGIRTPIDRSHDGYWIHERPMRHPVPTGRSKRGHYTTDRLNAAASCWLAYRALGLRADIVESPEWMAEGLAIESLSRTPCVVSLHTPTHLIYGNNDVAIGRDLGMADRLERTLARRARLVTSPSELLAQTLVASRWLNERPRLVRHPIDLAMWRDIPGADTTPPYVLVVGRLEPRKAPELVLEAAAKLRNHVADLEVVFVGDGWLRSDGRSYAEWLATRAATLDLRARLVGVVDRDELRSYYARARVVAVPSRFESLSMVALEGMASARPVVCTDSVGAGELIAGTDAGAVVPSGNASSLADALAPYLTDGDRAAKAGLHAREVVEHFCEPDAIATERAQLYSEIAATN
jgi:glycogen synthase